MANGPTVKSLVLIAAVAVVAGVVGSYVWQQPGAVAVLGGGPPTPIIEFPKDEVVPAPVLEFKWRGAADLTRVVVIDLADPKKPIIDRVVAGDKYAPIDEERSAFVSGRQYHWFVESQIEGGTRSSTAAQFTIR